MTLMSFKVGALVALTLAATATLVESASGGAVEAPGAAATTDTQDPKSVETPNTDIAKKRGNLSDKLNSTNGVIHPEGDIDPGLSKPAPPDGAIKVIPPPENRGGNPEVQPK